MAVSLSGTSVKGKIPLTINYVLRGEYCSRLFVYRMGKSKRP